MKPHPLEKQYSMLTGEERFRLILAAGVREDESEQHRLMRTAGTYDVRLPNYSPYAIAIDELSQHTFTELLELSASYLEALLQADLAMERHLGQNDSANITCGQELCDRTMDIALAAGFQLNLYWHAWQLFCKDLSVSPLKLWETLAGFDRVQQAITLAERVAFSREEMYEWLLQIRPGDKNEREPVVETPEVIAESLQQAFDKSAQLWGG